MAAPPDPELTPFEQHCHATLAAAGIRLRHDRVARRVLAAVRAALSDRIPPDTTVMFTLTAPIRQPARTAAALIDLLASVPPEGVRATVCGNEVSARLVVRGRHEGSRVIGFVHSPEQTGRWIVDLAHADIDCACN